MAQTSAPSLPGIEHIVVLMLENRSFDNILGWLYDPDNPKPFNQVPDGQTFNGVSGKNLTNPAGPGKDPVPVGSTTDTTNPYPDPGEIYQDIYGQLYNVNPPPMPPNVVPANPPQPPPMSGFVENYALQKGVTQPGNIMNGFRPNTLINLCTLANQFVVCDNWFASVPSQTLTNRSFMHAGTASGYVNNDLDGLPLFVNDTTTIFNLLEEQNVSWRIYYGSHWFFCMAFLNQRRIERYMFALGPRRMFPFQTFLEDAKNGTLPSYSFIEPNFIDSVVYGRENDMHPDAAILNWDGKPSDALFGDELVGTIYQALLSSPQWSKTLLVITYDEHGGCYDHVAPPAATPPDDRIIKKGDPGYSGFGFNRYGVRVPAVIVSPLLQSGAVDHTLYDHTSILRTVMAQFNVTGDLGQRTVNANLLAPPFANSLREDSPSLSAKTDLVASNVVSDNPPTHIQSTLIQGAAVKLADLGAPPANHERLHSRLSAEAELQRVAQHAALNPETTPARFRK